MAARSLNGTNPLLDLIEFGRLLEKNVALAVNRPPPRLFGNSATPLWSASALLLATNLVWILAVALNLLGPLGPFTAGVLGWLVLSLDLPGVALLAAAYAVLNREQGRESSLLRVAIIWGFVGWVALSAFWRFLLPLTRGTDLHDLVGGLVGANPGGLALC